MIKPQIYAQAIQDLASGIKNIKSKYPKSNIIKNLVDAYLSQLLFPIEVFKNVRSKRKRQEVLISKDGSSIVGSENIDNYFAKSLKGKVKFKKV